MIRKLHAEVLPLVDVLQEIGARGVYNLGKMPYRGLQWKYRAYQRDPFVVAFVEGMPSTFGTFVRCDEVLSQRRLVFHSSALNADLVLRRRGSIAAFRPSPSSGGAASEQGAFFPQPERVAKGKSPRVAALIWDTPVLNTKHKAVSPMPVAVKLAKPGRLIDDNDWEAGFRLPANSSEDLIPERIEYHHDMPDWDVDSETDAR